MDSLGPNELALAQACQYFASSPGLPSSLSRFSLGAVAFAATTFKKDKAEELADDKGRVKMSINKSLRPLIRPSLTKCYVNLSIEL
jgi:hypothetical protein